LRLTETISSLLAEDELAGIDRTRTDRIVASGRHYIQELHAIVHRQRERFDFEGHGRWVMTAISEEVVLQNALDAIRSGEEPSVTAAEMVESSRAGMWARLRSIETGRDDEFHLAEAQIIARATGRAPWDD